MGVVGGDFNMVLKRKECSNNQFSTSISKEFNDNLELLNLTDFPLMGGSWTWSNQRATPLFSRIDRFLINSFLLLKLPGLCQRVLSRPIFNHFPILLVDNEIAWGLIPFHFDNKLLKLESFKEMVWRV